jgi:hypothetical protein
MHIRSVRTMLFALVMLCMSASSFAQIGVMITIAPPAIPVYEQPICPGDGYIWTPGYWAWGDDFDDYYWVPGTWVEAPEVGFLWTPGYWGWNADRFVFTDGYWGPHVGFYGGINYGFGYFGNGYEGGRWDNGHFFYNRAVTRVNVTVIHNVYNTKVVENERTRISYNGGNGGINARPTPEQETAVRERHVAPVAAQTQHLQAARSNNQQRASVNRGKPEIAATAKPGEFSGRDVVKAKKAGGAYTPSPNRGGNQPKENAAVPRPNNNSNSNAGRPNTAVHPGDLPTASRPAAPNTGNAKLDQKYQQQQQKQSAKQDQERQKLQQKQEKEHQQLAQHNANDARKQQVEQKHQQQTQQLQQRHEQQQQKLQARQQPATSRAQPKR